MFSMPDTPRSDEDEDEDEDKEEDDKNRKSFKSSRRHTYYSLRVDMDLETFRKISREFLGPGSKERKIFLRSRFVKRYLRKNRKKIIKSIRKRYGFEKGIIGKKERKLLKAIAPKNPTTMYFALLRSL